MTRSAYIIGGAGVGKSYLTARVLYALQAGPAGPLEVLHEKPNRTNLVRLRGHRLADGGLYLGVLRDHHPGTDGLDRASHKVAAEWLWTHDLPPYILAEGRLLSGAEALSALCFNTDTLVVHLRADPRTHQNRISRRGTTQKSSYVKSTVTGAQNAAERAVRYGARVSEWRFEDWHEQEAVEEIVSWLK